MNSQQLYLFCILVGYGYICYLWWNSVLSTRIRRRFLDKYPDLVDVIQFYEYRAWKYRLQTFCLVLAITLAEFIYDFHTGMLLKYPMANLVWRPLFVVVFTFYLGKTLTNRKRSPKRGNFST